VSVQALGWVLDRAEARLGARLVLIALANHAHDDGSNAFISQERIATEARLTGRQVRRCLKELEAAGEITRTGTKHHGVVVWQINMRSKMSDGQIVRGHLEPPARTNPTERVSEMSDKPSVNRQEPSGGRAQARDTHSRFNEAVIES
jgi:hypothetical protein